MVEGRDNDIKRFLESVPLFEKAPERSLEIASAAVQFRRYESQTTVFQEGDVGEALYILASGLIKLSKVDLGGHEKTLAILQPPEFFGEMALVGEAARSATAITLGEVTAYLLFHDDFNRLTTDFPSIGRETSRPPSHGGSGVWTTSLRSSPTRTPRDG